MRCSKCGYISFDHLESCPKCQKPMNVAGIKGTGFPVTAPLFFQPAQPVEELESVNGMAAVLDPDLDLFADVADEVVDFGGPADESEVVMAADEGESASQIALGDDFERVFASGSIEKAQGLDREELAVDENLFGNRSEGVAPVVGLEVAGLEIPEELADISDLAPPSAPGSVAPPAEPSGRDQSKRGLLEELNLDDLRLDDLKLSFDDGDRRGPAAPGGQTDQDLLSLEEIDLSTAFELGQPQSSSPLPGGDPNLDMGGEVEKKRGDQKKAGDDFPDFTLSLD